jgi:hypothetical protein
MINKRYYTHEKTKRMAVVYEDEDGALWVRGVFKNAGHPARVRESEIQEAVDKKEARLSTKLEILLIGAE